MEDGPALKRPPHRLFAPLPGFEEEDFVMASSIAYSKVLATGALALALLSAPVFCTTAGADTAAKPGELTETKPAKPVPALTLMSLADESPTDLSAYKGKPLIVNLWATWCGPCITEMPSLMKLSDRLKDSGVTVIAISEDRGGKFVVDPFLKEHNIAGLPIFLDKTMSTGKALKEATVLPMTILIDADGNEIGRVRGDRDWDSTESRAELAKLFNLKGI